MNVSDLEIPGEQRIRCYAAPADGQCRREAVELLLMRDAIGSDWIARGYCDIHPAAAAIDERHGIPVRYAIVPLPADARTAVAS